MDSSNITNSSGVYLPTISVNSSLDEINRLSSEGMRRLYLYGEITPIGEDELCFPGSSLATKLIDSIINYNRDDSVNNVAPEKREPIIMYINSPGGDVSEGFALISVMELSKTPIYTVNMGNWCSMAFLIGIAGKKRLSLPNVKFLLHEGYSMAGGSVNKMQDQVEFESRFDETVVKKHVLSHSKMSESSYDKLKRVELYMLPEDALEHGFIDEIVTDIDTIL